MNFTEATAAVAKLEADLATAETNYNEALDTVWMLLASMLVFFMHAGFSLLEAGSVRFKNTQNILAKNLIVVTAGFLCWYSFGYPFAFGTVEKKPSKFMGGTNFFMDQFWKSKDKFRFWFFQGAFCATGATIVSGAMAERTQLKGFTTYTFLMCTIIYPVVVFWGWSGGGFLNYAEKGLMCTIIYPVVVFWGWSGGGFLNYAEKGTGNSISAVGPPVIDFAGSGLVHLVGGVGALCGAVLVGPRKGRWEPKTAAEFDGHSVPFCVLGTFFLWFGWYGFNPGSTGAMHTKDNAYQAGLVAANTTISPCVAGLLVFLLRAKVVPPKLLDVGGFCNGILGGLVSITAGCSSVKPWEAAIIGAIGGAIYQGSSMALKAFKVDDVVDAFPVHGACGLWGLLALGFFGDPDHKAGGNGALYGGNQLGTQLFAGLMIILWVGTLSSIIFFCLRQAGMLRMGDEFQEKGADMMEHSPSKAYEQNQEGGDAAAGYSDPPPAMSSGEETDVNVDAPIGGSGLSGSIRPRPVDKIIGLDLGTRSEDKLISLYFLTLDY
eukprot:CAMPEP_0204610358 /NCGR_PEP_ID=MMETSP0661-20131031/61461_1 /ASSEMBLY_ACC=CAM_ASM_000606 /TAXON_ID=109239 /ORGANISM="Alexandrium margalefi, Strain AMGDE01CS-322" /LENGTH=546 /DNA_ID=CAMNT_0051622165 /DNA_START=58 /DNA_END=1697 /DNA_ORIENTATION=+